MPAKRKLKVVKLPQRYKPTEAAVSLLRMTREIVADTDIEGYFIMAWGKEGRPISSLYNGEKSGLSPTMIPTVAQELSRGLINRSDTAELLDEIFGD